MAKSGERKMLFDLQRGKRRRVVQVIYGTLALLMGGGLIFFGIGSNVQGGLFDAFDSGSNSGNPQFEEEAQKLERKLKADPNNPQLLAATTRAWYTAANSQVEYDPNTGAPLGFPQGAINDFERAGAAWQRYLDTKPEKPNSNVAGLAATALFYSGASATTASDFERSIKEAVETQAIFAEAEPSLNSYVTLARYSYYAGDFEGGDRAAAKAKQETTSAQAASLKQAIAQYRKDGKKIAKQIKVASKFKPSGQGKQALENPLGGLSGGGSGLSAPAP
ncbi:MAG: hypothetical protein AABM29_08535 [Actinomycetota bacterium]